MEQSITGRCSRGNKLTLAPWKGSVTRCGGMTTLVRREVPPEREKGGDDDSWTHTNLTGPKNKENSHSRFSYYK
jgi:hypothetical protein